MVEYLVVGAGPAGLQMGHFLHEAGRDYVILEAGGSAGTFFRTFPRHRVLATDDNSLISATHPPFSRYSKRSFPAADDLVRYLSDFARPLNIRYDTWATTAHLERARHVIIATGRAKPYLPPIPGIEYAETYATASTDPTAYANKKVLIIGRGHSAFETADHISPTAALTHTAGRTVRCITEDLVVSFENAGELRYDKVIVCAGFRRDTTLDVPEAHLLHGGSIREIRHNARALHRRLEAEHHGTLWPHKKLPNRPDAIAATIATRAGHIPDGLADVVVPQGQYAFHYDEMPPPHRTGFVVTRRQVAHFRNGELIATEHDLHRKPLERFLSRQLAVPCIA